MTANRSVTDPAPADIGAGMSDEPPKEAAARQRRGGGSIGDPRAGKADAPSAAESAREPLHPDTRVRIYRRNMLGNPNNGRHGTIIRRVAAASPLWVVLLDGNRRTVCVHQRTLQPLDPGADGPDLDDAA